MIVGWSRKVARPHGAMCGLASCRRLLTAGWLWSWGFGTFWVTYHHSCASLSSGWWTMVVAVKTREKEREAYREKEIWEERERESIWKGDEGGRAGWAWVLSQELPWPMNIVNMGQGLVGGEGDEREWGLSLSFFSQFKSFFFFFLLMVEYHFCPSFKG